MTPLPAPEYARKKAESWQHYEDSAALEVWHLWQNGNIAAELFLEADLDPDSDNAHIFSFDLFVLAHFRRGGYAGQLLPKVLAFANSHKRTLAIVETSSLVPAGTQVADHLGAKRGIAGKVNQLPWASWTTG